MAVPDKIKEAVGYGFDATVRKGTDAGSKAMEGFISKYTDAEKTAIRKQFNDKIKSQTILDNKLRITKGDDQVKVYRNAAQTGQKIVYDKTFDASGDRLKATKVKNVTSVTKKSDATPITVKPISKTTPAPPTPDTSTIAGPRSTAPTRLTTPTRSTVPKVKKPTSVSRQHEYPNYKNPPLIGDAKAKADKEMKAFLAGIAKNNAARDAKKTKAKVNVVKPKITAAKINTIKLRQPTAAEVKKYSGNRKYSDR
jgi:hypothetical protein